jgi:hypothetical protein
MSYLEKLYSSIPRNKFKNTSGSGDMGWISTNNPTSECHECKHSEYWIKPKHNASTIK